MRRLTVIALFLRIFIAVSTRTFFQPDEYFQSLEVAHHLVFGYGHLTWEWKSPQPIRSILYPVLNVPVYWALKVLKLDDTVLLVVGPKVLHGILAAGTDIWLADWTRKVLGERYVSVAVFLSLTSFFHALSLSRSISNSLETTLTTIALSYFPWNSAVVFDRGTFRTSVAFAALACAVRPTNAVLWVYMLMTLCWRMRGRPRQCIDIVVNIITIGVVTLSSVVAIDSAYYGTLTLTPFNFVLTNLSSVSLFYGTSPWHYYLSQALPLLCTTSLPFVVHGASVAMGPSSTQASRIMLGLIAWTTTIYSFAGHKEWRFLHPLLPLMHILASKSLVDSYYANSAKRTARSHSLPIRLHHLCLILLAIPAIVYVTFVHSEPQISVMHYLRGLAPGEAQCVGFLMPCHSTPWQAYLHRPELGDSGKLWALGCEPPLFRGKNMTSYRDQTDIFYASPIAYLQDRFPHDVDPAFPPSPFPGSVPGQTSLDDTSWRHEWPKYLILFGALLRENRVRDLLVDKGYREVWARERGWEGDQRRNGGVRVWKYISKSREIHR